MTEHFTNRVYEQHVVDSVLIGDDGWVQVTSKSHSTFGFCPTETDIQLTAGDSFVLELDRSSKVAGVMKNGVWLMRKSDEELAHEHAQFVHHRHEQLRIRWEARQDEWLQRERALPEWIKPRLATFHDRGGENFEIDGWEYELQIAELAAMYRESGGEDTPSISEYAALYGTSGNQHAFAKVLAATPPDVSVAETVSALAPIGVDPFYAPRTDDHDA